MLEGLVSRMNQNNHQQQQQVLLMEESLSNLTSASGEASNSSINPSVGEAPNFPISYPPNLHQQEQQQNYFTQQNPAPNKRKRSLPGNPDPDSEVIALSPKSLLAKNRFICEICNKGFQRDQNLQLHRRGHNLPWKLKQRSKTEVVRKKVYVCPEISCVHHDPSRALGDLTGIKKHFCRKHGEKKWKCEKCNKKYAVQSDWKAHSKICGTREYKCDCGTIFSRRDSFITHRAFCDVLAEEAAARTTASNPLLLPTPTPPPPHHHHHHNNHQQMLSVDQNPQMINTQDLRPPFFSIKQEFGQQHQSQSFNLMPPWVSSSSSAMNMFSSHGLLQRNPSQSLGGAHFSAELSATAMLQKAAQIGASMSSSNSNSNNKITAQIHPPFQFAAATSACQRGPPDHVPTTAGFGLNLSSHEQNHTQQQHQQQQEEMNNNNNNMDDGFFTSPTSCCSSSTMLLNDVMMTSLPSSFGGDGLTKDFLGLSHLSTSDILTFAGLNNNSITNFAADAAASSSNSHHHHQDLLNKSWQG